MGNANTTESTSANDRRQKTSKCKEPRTHAAERVRARLASNAAHERAPKTNGRTIRFACNDRRKLNEKRIISNLLHLIALQTIFHKCAPICVRQRDILQYHYWRERGIFKTLAKHELIWCMSQSCWATPAWAAWPCTHTRATLQICYLVSTILPAKWDPKYVCNIFIGETAFRERVCGFVRHSWHRHCKSAAATDGGIALCVCLGIDVSSPVCIFSISRVSEPFIFTLFLNWLYSWNFSHGHHPIIARSNATMACVLQMQRSTNGMVLISCRYQCAWGRLQCFWFSALLAILYIFNLLIFIAVVWLAVLHSSSKWA